MTPRVELVELDAATLRALLDRAAADKAATTVRASVSPGNDVSRDLVVEHGFIEVGQQEDEEDGLEIVYERPVGASPVARA
jgi:L-amino acid N-acyltransferase YncA